MVIHKNFKRFDPQWCSNVQSACCSLLEIMTETHKGSSHMSIWSDPTQVSQIHSTSLPSRPSDVSQSTADAAALQEVVHGDVWAQLGTCPDIARLQQTPPENCCEKSRKNKCSITYRATWWIEAALLIMASAKTGWHWPPALFHKTEII